MKSKQKIVVPRHLSPKAKQWFLEITQVYEFETHHTRLLTAACECWDRAEQARKVLDCQGTTYMDRFGAPRPRPEVKIELDNKLAFGRFIKDLGLDLAETGSIGRPAGK
jgi:phage terminase small subunit